MTLISPTAANQDPRARLETTRGCCTAAYLAQPLGGTTLQHQPPATVVPPRGLLSTPSVARLEIAPNLGNTNGSGRQITRHNTKV